MMCVLNGMYVYVSVCMYVCMYYVNRRTIMNLCVHIYHRVHVTMVL